MRAVIQRVSQASVSVDQQIIGQIDQGLLVFVGIETQDGQEDIDWLCAKIINMRIFSDTAGKMNLSLKDIGGEMLLISQFTLHASTKKGHRPSFIQAAHPDIAVPLYEKLIQHMELLLPQRMATGEFGAHMEVNLCNDGPVTIWLDSKNKS